MDATRTCSVDGCDQKFHANGYCSTHNHRMKRYGDPNATQTPGRLLSPIDTVRLNGWTVTADGCWEYDGKRDKNGYGQIISRRRAYRVHRVMWEHANGRPIPDGMLIRHACDNPPCCNPEHLSIGTHADNMQDQLERDRRPLKLDRRERAEVVALVRSGEVTRAAIADHYGVSTSSISKIVETFPRPRDIEPPSDVTALVRAINEEAA